MRPTAGRSPTNERVGGYMQVTINLDRATLDDLEITIDEFKQAAKDALRNLSHPESGDPIFFNDVSVTVFADVRV